MNEIGIQAQQLQLLLEPLAAMMVKKIHPVQDEMTKNAAYREYGRGWIDEQVLAGNLAPKMKGKKHIYSRSDIETLRAVSLQTPKVIIRSTTGKRR